jgi:transmembrane sensor
MEEQNKYISDLLIRYVNGLYTRNDIETLRKLASSITERAELESEMDRVWNEAQDLPQSDSHNHLLYKKEIGRLFRCCINNIGKRFIISVGFI